jgi:CarD family transcriptional regulator
MEYQVGDKAVVPSHGVGVVTEIVERDFGNGGAAYYTFKILDNGMSVLIPVGRVEENRIRDVISDEMIEEVYDVLADRERPADKQTWNRRYREYMNKIKTGDPLQVAAVLRDLAILRSEKTLSFGERKMYDQAHGLIVQEIAVARDVDEDVIKEELEDLFKRADADAAKGGKRAIKKKKK